MKIDYKEIFKNRVIYITGVGRSGTTIVGQIFASMRPSYYLFEPAILRAPLCDNPPCFPSYDTLRRNVFEDYFLPQIHGRCNPNPYDWTYWGNYYEEKSIKLRWRTLHRRDDAIELIQAENPWWIIKNPEAQLLTPELEKVFPGITFINMYRNGLNVIASNVERGWFTEDYQPIDPIDNVGRPWYIPLGQSEDWEKWNPATKSACNWRILSEIEMPNSVKYEDFCKSPFKYIDGWSVEYGLSVTDLTTIHLQKVKEWKPGPTSKVKITDIMQPERDRFIEAMKKLEYDI